MGYAAFSVSPSNVAEVERYIATQKEHRRRVTFQDELRKFLAAHGIQHEERYVWD